MNRVHRIKVGFTGSEAERLKRLAEEQGIPVSGLIRRAFLLCYREKVFNGQRQGRLPRSR